MRIDGFDWNEGNTVKNIVRHNTYPNEIEETFYNRYKLRKTKQGRYLLYGITSAGRYLFVVFIFKKKWDKTIVRVISAREMTQKEKKYYKTK